MLFFQEKDSAKKRLHESNTLCRRLERENTLLTKQVQELSDELESSRSYIDKLLEQKVTENEWSSKEKEYKQIISNLRAQIRGGEAMVSLALYRKAVGEARARALECQEKKLELKDLSTRLRAMEQRLMGEWPHLKARQTPSDEQPADTIVRKVTPTSASSDENSYPFTPNDAIASNVGKSVKKSSHPPPPPPPPPPPVSYRISAVQKAGGRAGLCAKLKQMRGSPLAKKKAS